MRKLWINGAIHGEAEARISPFDHGFLVGDGVFETLAAHGGRVFAMRRHWDRLCRGGAALGIAIPECELLRGAAEEVLRLNGLEEARVRITVTGGPAPLGSEKGDEGSTVVVAAAPLPVWDAAAAVVTVAYPRNERGALSGLKTTSYGENVLALSEARRKGASEAIFGNTRGELCEGTGSNIFVVRGGEVLTPPLESGCLAGITRGLVLEVARAQGIAAREVVLPFEVLAEEEEVFLTSTTRQVQPVALVDGRRLALAPGEMTARLADGYRRLVAAQVDP